MPLDSTGQYRHNHEAAAMHSKAAGKEYKPDGEDKPEGGGDHVEIHAHGDGSFHTMHKGEKVEHPTLGHALIHAAKIHAEDGHKHFHGHHDGMTHHSHSVESGGEVESRENDDVDGMHNHLAEAMGGEQEPDGDEAEPAMEGKGLGGLY